MLLICPKILDKNTKSQINTIISSKWPLWRHYGSKTVLTLTHITTSIYKCFWKVLSKSVQYFCQTAVDMKAHSSLPLFQQNGRHDVTNKPNYSKLTRTLLHLGETNFGKFHPNRSGSFAIRLWTDTHTDRQTHMAHRHSRYFPRKDHNTFSQWND